MNFTSYISYVAPMVSEYQDMYKERRDELRDKWQESKVYPRKRKKRVRKILLLDWNINEWLGNYMNIEL